MSDPQWIEDGDVMHYVVTPPNSWMASHKSLLRWQARWLEPSQPIRLVRVAVLWPCGAVEVYHDVRDGARRYARRHGVA